MHIVEQQCRFMIALLLDLAAQQSTVLITLFKTCNELHCLQGNSISRCGKDPLAPYIMMFENASTCYLTEA